MRRGPGPAGATMISNVRAKTGSVSARACCAGFPADSALAWPSACLLHGQSHKISALIGNHAAHIDHQTDDKPRGGPMGADVTIGDGEGAPAGGASVARGGAGRSPCPPIHRHRGAAPRAAFRVRHRRRTRRDRPRIAGAVLQRTRVAGAEAGGQASSRGVRRDRLALGAAFRIHHLYLGAARRHRRRQRDPVPPAGLVDRGPDGERAAAGPAPGRGRSASGVRPERRRRAGTAVRPRQSRRRREFRRQRRLCHRFPERSGRLRARAGARPRPGAGTRRRAGAAGDRAGDLSHAGIARPAEGAGLDAIDQPHRAAAWRK